jgi:hypothetical protein
LSVPTAAVDHLLSLLRPSMMPAAFSPEDVKDILALILLGCRARPGQLSGDLLRVMAEFAGRIGWDGAPSTPLARVVDGYFVNHPPNSELLKQVQPLLRETFGEPRPDPRQLLAAAHLSSLSR